MDVCTARIAQLSEYFDALANLVPFKHYVDTDDYVDVRSMKQKERFQVKAAFKQQHKVAKRAKLDPDAEISTTSAQRDVNSDRGQNGAAPLAPWLAPANGGGAFYSRLKHVALFGSCRKRPCKHAPQYVKIPGKWPHVAWSCCADHGDLKERLNSKIKTMREQRKAEERKEMAAKARAWKQKQHEAGVLANKKQKRCADPCVSSRLSRLMQVPPQDTAPKAGLITRPATNSQPHSVNNATCSS